MDEALKKWDFAIKLDRDFTDALYNSACALYELAMRQKDATENERTLKQVIDRYESLLKTAVPDVDAMVNLAAAYRTSVTLDTFERELELLKQAAALAPNYGLVYLNLGHSFAKYGGWKEIGAHLNDIYEKGSATVSINIDFLQRAVECYKIAAECNEKFAETCRTLSEGVTNLINLCREAASR